MDARTYHLEVKRDGATWRAWLIEVGGDKRAPRAAQRFDSPLALLEFLERDLPLPADDHGLD
jgi:hypothetical protein